MNKLMVAAIAAAVLASRAAWAQTPAPDTPRFQPKPYFEMPLDKDPTRQVRLQNVVIPPGASTQFHTHPGDQWWAVQEGEVVFVVKGQEPRVLKAGDSVYIPRGTIHRNINMSGKPARSIELNITDRDKPQTAPAAE